MAFYDQFLANFTTDEQDSEIVKIMAAIGTKSEKAILEDIEAQINLSTDIFSFPSDKIRSWLAAILYQIPNVVSAEGTVTMTLTSADAAVSISSGENITSSSGLTFQTENAVYLSEGESVTLHLIQGQTNTATGTYSEYIAISASDVDLSDLEVYIGTEEVSEIDYDQSYEVPKDGYYAFYYNDTLYIKIFKGDDVPDPEDKTYTVTYRTSDGADGNIDADSIDDFEDTITDINGDSITYTFSNDAFTSGADEPTRFKLLNILRNTFYVKESLSTIEEYKTWLLARSEIGDCVVEGDYQRYINTGDESITGVVTVYAMDADGNALTASTESTLLEDMEDGYKDIGWVEFDDFEYVQQYFDIKYESSTDDSAFQSHLKSVFAEFYDLDWVHDNSYSLFEDLDLDTVRSEIDTDLYSPAGISITPYHYREYDISEGDSTFTGYYYDGETYGGYYEYYETATDSDSSDTLIDTFTEYYDPTEGIVYIYSSDGTEIGTRNDDGTVSITYDFAYAGTIKCYWLIEDPGIVPLGAENAARELAGVTIAKYSD